ncbi:MAG: hypothetical protein ACRELX_11305 [Longimicrobiales bacterium]
MTMRRAACALALTMTPLVSACATGAQGSGEGVQVEVNNDLIPSSALTVYVLPEIGARRLIGNVNPSETTTLQFEEVAVGQYRLMARTTGGNEIVSNPISLANVAAITWDLSSNILTVKEERS